MGSATTLDHDDITSLLAAYACDALGADEAAVVADHVEACRGCRTEIDRFRATLVELVADRHAPPRLRRRLRRAIGRGEVRPRQSSRRFR